MGSISWRFLANILVFVKKKKIGQACQVSVQFRQLTAQSGYCDVFKEGSKNVVFTFLAREQERQRPQCSA